MKYVGTFGGPSAPWADEDDFLPAEDDPSFQLAAMAKSLAGSLERRAAILKANPTRDAVALEIRMQMCAHAVNNDVGALWQLSDLLYSAMSVKLPQPDMSDRMPWWDELVEKLAPTVRTMYAPDDQGDEADTVWPDDRDLRRDEDEDDTGSSGEV